MKVVMTQAVCQEGMELLQEEAGEKAEVYVADDSDPNHYLDKMQTGTKWGCSNDTMMSSGKRKAAS